MSSIKLTADSNGGTFELKAPASSRNTRVLTLPDAANRTVLTTTSPKAGNIIQVVSAENTAVQSYSGTSQYHTAMSINITPSATSSKIFVCFNMNIGVNSTGSGTGAKILRGSTDILIGGADGSRTRGQVAQFTCHSNTTNTTRFITPSYLDSPNTTSQVTYNFQVYCSSQTIFINRSAEDVNSADNVRGASFAYAMEVAA